MTKKMERGRVKSYKINPGLEFVKAHFTKLYGEKQDSGSSNSNLPPIGITASEEYIELAGIISSEKHLYHPKGTLCLLFVDDRRGRRVRERGNSNLGYSGYCHAIIFDGEKWRKFKLSELAPYRDRSYEYASQRRDVLEGLQSVVSRFRGRLAYYDSSTRCFRIKSRI